MRPLRLLLLAFVLIAAAPPAHATLPDDVMGGRIVAAEGGHTTLFPVLKTELAADIRGDLATVTVTQTFTNPGTVPLNATYLFPLPEKAAVYGMVMAVGDERIEAQIKQRAEATADFEAAKREGRNAALLTQERPNVFTQALANLMPGQPITVTLRYVQSVPKIDGTYELVMPLVVGPRYEKGPSPILPVATAVADVRPSGAGAGATGGWSFDHMPDYPPVAALTIPQVIDPERVSIRVRLAAGLPIASAGSPTHVLARQDESPETAIFGLSRGEIIDNRDFIFRYRLAGARTAAGFLTHADARGGFFSLLIEPPAVPAPAEIAPREMVFLLDCSGSMDGLPIAASKAFMRAALTHLRPTDSFRIIRFSDQANEMSRAPLPASVDNIARGLAYVETLKGEGGTNMDLGIVQALRVAAPPGAVRLVTFLTDGYIGDEASVLRLVTSTIGDARLYAFGVGTGVNRFLLSELGRVGRGFTRYMDPTEDVDKVVGELVDRLQSPVLTDIAIDWGGLDPTAVTPAALPDLFAGQSVRVQGRYDPAKVRPTHVTVRGKVNGKPAELPVAVAFADDPGGEALPLVWARSTIEDRMAALMAPPALRPNGVTDESLKQEVTRLGLDFSLMTQWTSFIAVSKRVANAAPALAQDSAVPLPMVAGVTELAYPDGASGMTASSTPEPAALLGLALAGILAGWLLLRPRRGILGASL